MGWAGRSLAPPPSLPPPPAAVVVQASGGSQLLHALSAATSTVDRVRSSSANLHRIRVLPVPQGLIKQYSEFISFPIKLWVTASKPQQVRHPPTWWRQ